MKKENEEEPVIETEKCPACLGDKLNKTPNKCYRCDGLGWEIKES